MGTKGKLEAFAPSHGVRTLDPTVVNYRRGIRSSQIVDAWNNVDPPSPEDCGELHEMHIGVDEALLEAGNHCGATYEEVRAFTAAVLDQSPPTVSLSDGSKAVMMGLAAHLSIETGQPVYWQDMISEFDAAAQGQKATSA